MRTHDKRGRRGCGDLRRSMHLSRSQPLRVLDGVNSSRGSGFFDDFKSRANGFSAALWTSEVGRVLHMVICPLPCVEREVRARIVICDR
jgi:hypothetical protein